jgi:hypothetical protein
MEMLRRKELADELYRQKEAEKLQQLLLMKSHVQQQMIEREQLREQAYEEYARERAQVDAIINRMIEEDHESIRLNRMKQEQSK